VARACLYPKESSKTRSMVVTMIWNWIKGCESSWEIKGRGSHLKLINGYIISLHSQYPLIALCVTIPNVLVFVLSAETDKLSFTVSGPNYLYTGYLNVSSTSQPSPKTCIYFLYANSAPKYCIGTGLITRQPAGCCGSQDSRLCSSYVNMPVTVLDLGSVWLAHISLSYYLFGTLWKSRL
jgi:hypothetical protein